MISREMLADALGCQNDGPDVEFRKYFVCLGSWSFYEAKQRFGVEWVESKQMGKCVSYAGRFTPHQNILFFLFSMNVILRKSEKNEV